jgi:hypothetical protein
MAKWFDGRLEFPLLGELPGLYAASFFLYDVIGWRSTGHDLRIEQNLRLAARICGRASLIQRGR